MINSRRKGAAGEREWALTLRQHGWDARRGQQYSGLEGEDVVSDLPLHWEVKRVERLNIHDAVDQAKRDSIGKLPAVAHRRNYCEWLVTMTAEDFLAMMTLALDDQTIEDVIKFATLRGLNL